VKRTVMMAVAVILAVIAIGVIVWMGFVAAQVLVFALEMAAKLTEEMR
jgi:hypothetical protein